MMLALYLHSIMGGFERPSLVTSPLWIVRIYIPLWVDLKAPPTTIIRRLVTHLHSIMGGFESPRAARAASTPTTIYIPLWVDLKVGR